MLARPDDPMDPTRQAAVPHTEAGTPARDAARAATVLPAVAYPVLAHLAVVTASPGLTVASVAVLALAVLLPGLISGRLAAWVGALLAACAIVLLARQDAAGLVLFLPPVLINFFLAWLFGHTLARGHRPLIERLVRLLHPPGEVLDPEVVRYARSLTATWTVLLGGLGFLNLLLALLASPGGLLETAGVAPPVAVPIETWSLFANLLNYLVVGAFFVAEWFYRRRRFPQQQYRNLFDFLRQAAGVGPALLADLRGGRGGSRA